MGFSSSAARRGETVATSDPPARVVGAGAKNEAGQSQNSILVYLGLDGMNGHTEDW